MPYQKYGLLKVSLLIILSVSIVSLYNSRTGQAQTPSGPEAAGAIGFQQSTRLDFARSRFPADFGTLPKGKYGTIDKNSLSSPDVSVLESPRDLFQLDTRMSTGTSGTIRITNVESLEKTYEKLSWTLAIYRRDSDLRQWVPREPEWILVGKSDMGILAPELSIQIPKGSQFLIAMENVTFRLRNERSESGITIPRFSLNYFPTAKSAPLS